MRVFSPGSTTTLSGTTTTSMGALSGTGSQIEINNAGSVTVFVKLGSSTVTAATSDYPVLAGQCKLITRDPEANTHIAVITASSTATVYATVGEGE